MNKVLCKYYVKKNILAVKAATHINYKNNSNGRLENVEYMKNK